MTINQTWWDFVQWSAREQILSSDLNRMGKLASNVTQRRDRDMGRGDPLRDPATGLARYTGQGDPIAGRVLTGTIAGRSTSYDVDVGPFSLYVPVPATDGTDGIDYQVIAYEGGVVTWPGGSGPDVAIRKWAIIYALPTMVDADDASRNILENAVTRTTNNQLVPKTKKPSVVLGVEVSTTAQAPALPSGAIALWDVHLPQLAYAINSLAFTFNNRIWPKIEYPLSSYHGILQGCVPEWQTDGVDDPATKESEIYLSRTKIHRCVIDGELLYFSGVEVSADRDSFAPCTAVGITNDVPFYIYLCGGRNMLPNGAGRSIDYNLDDPSNNMFAPIQMVQSKSPPDKFGRSTVNLMVGGISIPKAATLYVGIGFSTVGLTLNKPCIIDGDWVRPANSYHGAVTVVKSGPIFLQPLSKAGSGGNLPIDTVFTLATNPIKSTLCEAVLSIFDSTNTTFSVKLYDKLHGVGNDAYTLLAANGVQNQRTQDRRVLNPFAQFATIAEIESETEAWLYAIGYNMNVPRLSL